MTLTKYTAATNIIETLGTNPEDRTDLDDSGFKRKFDLNAAQLKAFINDILTAEIDTIISTKADKVQEAWIAPTLLNGWVNFGSGANNVGYYKDQFGVVHLRGQIKSGNIGSPFANLPEGYRPAVNIGFVIISNDAVGRCAIQPNGNCIIYLGSNAWALLEGIAFRV